MEILQVALLDIGDAQLLSAREHCRNTLSLRLCWHMIRIWSNLARAVRRIAPKMGSVFRNIAGEHKEQIIQQFGLGGEIPPRWYEVDNASEQGCSNVAESLPQILA